MTLDDALGLFPLHNVLREVDSFNILKKIRIVPVEAMLQATVDPDPIKTSLALHRVGFSGLTEEVMKRAISWGEGAPLIYVLGKVYANRAVEPPFPSLLDVPIEQAIGEDNHWMWWGANRTVKIMEAYDRNDGWLLRYSAPQASYNHQGNWRRSSVAGILLGTQWLPRCPYGHSNCLRPDHWVEDTAGKPGRRPLTSVRSTRWVPIKDRDWTPGRNEARDIAERMLKNRDEL
jgi:hypothetical protein